jgi:hypothetical protein
MSVKHASLDLAHQGLVAPTVTITVSRGAYTVKAETEATVLGSRCPPFAAGTVIASFSRKGASYAGSYKVFDTQSCALYSLANLTVIVPASAHAGSQYAFYGVPPYAGTFTKA